MGVGAAADDGDVLGRCSVAGQRVRAFACDSDLAYVLNDGCESLTEANGLGGKDVGMQRALDAGEDGRLKFCLRVHLSVTG